jgi:hypothetical protein
MATALALCFVATTGAATSDGTNFPCTDAFAKEVAIASGFAEAAARVNPNYGNPKFWLAMQTVCADFDGDGNEEMVFSLGAMGGTDPWAFFDIPNGRASEATYSFPTIDRHGLYPNHGLELVQVEGRPAIRDKRRLFRPRDGHCCPTGGQLIRVVGFLGDSYSILESDVIRPPGLHKARLTTGLAKSAAAQFLGRKYGEAWYQRAGGRLICNRRLAFNVRKCEVSFVIGDSGFFGPLRIAFFERGPGDQHAVVRYRITRIDEYCAFVLHKPPRRCTKVDHGTARIHF